MATKQAPEIVEFNPCGFSFNEDFTACTFEDNDGESLEIVFKRAPRNENSTHTRVRKMARLCGRNSRFLKIDGATQWIAFVEKEEKEEKPSKKN